MAKRGADIQLTKDGIGQQAPNGETGIGGQKATAAQLAKRKILSARTTRPSARMAGGHTASPFKLVDPNIANGTVPQQTSFHVPPPSANSNSTFSFGSMNGNSQPVFANPFSPSVQAPPQPPAFPALGQTAQPSTSSSSLFATQPIPGFTTTFGAQPPPANPEPSTPSAPASSGLPSTTGGFIFGQTPSQAVPSIFAKPSEPSNLFSAPKPSIDPVREAGESTAAPTFTFGQNSQAASSKPPAAATAAPSFAFNQNSQAASSQPPAAATTASIFEQSQAKPALSAFSSFPPSTPSKNLFASSHALPGENTSLFPARPQPPSPEKAPGAAFTFNRDSTPSQAASGSSLFGQPNGQAASASVFSHTPTAKPPLFFPTSQPTKDVTGSTSTSIFGQPTQNQTSSSIFPPAPQTPRQEQTASALNGVKSPSDIEMTSPGHKSAETSLANGSIGVTDAHPVSSTSDNLADHGETSDLMPPSRPAGFSDEQFCQFVTAYRLKALDLSLKKFLKDEQNISDPLPFYHAKRAEILSAGGLPKPFTGVRRKVGEALDASTKRVNSINATMNGQVAYPALSAEAPATKRKADGPPAKEPTVSGELDGKRSRGNASGSSVGMPSLSETSKIFASVANGGSRATSKSAMPSTTPDHSPLKPLPRPMVPASTPTPSTQPSSSQAESSAPKALGPPTFGNITGTNFMAQFGDAAKKSAEKDAAARKAKQKAEEFDSEEDNEEEWEAKYAAEQEAKKRKVTEATKSGAFQLQANKQDDAAAAKPTTVESSSSSSLLKPPGGPGLFGGSLSPAHTASSESVLAGWKPTGSGASSPFSFSNPNSDAEGSKTGDADNEESDESDDDAPAIEPAKGAATASTTAFTTASATSASGKAGGRSLFDMIEYNADGTPKRELSPENGARDHGARADAAANPFVSSGNPFTSSDKPISFGGSPFASATSAFKVRGNTTASTNETSSAAAPTGTIGAPSASAPSNQYAFLRDTSSSLGASIFARKDSASKDPSATKETTATPATTASPGDNTWKPDSPIRFSDSTTAPTLSFTAPSPTKPGDPKPLGGLFGSANALSATSANPFAHLPSATQPTTASAGFGFGFGGPTSKPGSLFTTSAPSSTTSLTPAVASLTDSRATSPGATTADSEADSAVGAHEEPQAQLDLAESRRGEEDEDVLFAVKAKAREYAATSDAPRKEWVVRGVGQLRVLKHRTTSKTRVTLRAEPAGKVVLNAALMAGMEYERAGAKSVVFGAATDAGTLSKWSVLVGTTEGADTLASTLQAHKAS